MPSRSLQPIIPYAEVPDGVGLLIHLRTILDGSSPSAQVKYAKFVQEYAEQLADESARQEASTRAPGARAVEITESVVIRARESIDQQTSARQRPVDWKEAVALAGVPILSGVVGVLGGHLNSPLEWGSFIFSAAAAVICVLYSLKRRLL